MSANEKEFDSGRTSLETTDETQESRQQEGTPGDAQDSIGEDLVAKDNDKAAIESESREQSDTAQAMNQESNASRPVRMARKMRQMNQPKPSKTDNAPFEEGLENQQETQDDAHPGDALAVSRMNEKEADVENALSSDSLDDQQATEEGAATMLQQQVPKTRVNASDDMVAAPPLSNAVDEHGVSMPGAYSAPGRAFGSFPAWGRAQREQQQQPTSRRTMSRRFFHSVSSRFRTSRAHQEPSTFQVDAVLVEEEEHMERGEPPSSQLIVEGTPVESLEAKQRHLDKKWRCLLVLGVLVVIGAVVGIVVPLTNDSDDDSVVVTVDVTAVLQLDGSPQETGWSMDCDDTTKFLIPAGTYSGRENRLIAINTTAGVGQKCVVKVTDSGGNGIQDGTFEVYRGSNIRNQDALLAEGDGNFVNETTQSFVMDDIEITEAPTQPPSDAFLVVEVHLDEFPVETGWNLTCDNEVLIDYPPLTYTRPNSVARRIVPVEKGAQCLCTFWDTFDDGICCENSAGAEGSFAVFYFDDTHENFPLVERRAGDYQSGITFPFVAAPAERPSMVLVVVKVFLDVFPEEIGWSLNCGNIRRFIEIGTYTTPRPIDESFLVPKGTECVFVIEDEKGDGLGGGRPFSDLEGPPGPQFFSEDPFFEVLIIDENDIDNYHSVVFGTNFGFEKEVTFAAKLPGSV